MAELKPDPNGIIDLPEHFNLSYFSRTGEPMSDGLRMPGTHDGMADFTSPKGKTILPIGSNSSKSNGML